MPIDVNGREINSTNYEHSSEPNLNDLHKVMQYNVLGQPILRTTLGPTAADAFGRFRTSDPYTLFDSFHRYQDNGRISSYTNNATVTHEAYSSSVLMTVNGTLNSEAIRESSRVMAYQPGKSLLILETFCFAPARAGLRQRYGYFDTNNGLFLEQDGTNIYFVKRSSSANGTPQETRVLRENWNVTPLDGTGADKIVLDLSAAQIMFTQIEWLGVGTVTQGFVINGQLIPCHLWHWANGTGNTTTYMGTACLPLRAEIKDTAATGVSSTLRVICATVISEGGYEVRGRPRSVGHTVSNPYTLTTKDILYPVITMRLKTTRLGGLVIPKNFTLGIGSAANYRWAVVIGGTTSGGTWVDAGATDSSVEYNLTATSITGGSQVETGYINASNQASVAPSLSDFPFQYQLERNTFTGVATEFTICVVTDTANGPKAWCSVNWEEVT